MSNRWFARLMAWLLLVLASATSAQVDESQTGLWSMLFWSKSFDNSRLGLQGDIQYRQWDVGSDLEQLLLRGGLTYRPESAANILFTGGYANITSGTFGPSDADSNEHRLYQEGLISQRPADWLYLRHRFRLEQRWVSGQDFRTRLRYALFADIPLNDKELGKGAWYLSLYNEIFLNGERDIGSGRRVDYFDRNRTYAAVGYAVSERSRVQFGYMHQETDDVGKGQLQLSLHHSF